MGDFLFAFFYAFDEVAMHILRLLRGSSSLLDKQATSKRLCHTNNKEEAADTLCSTR